MEIETYQAEQADLTELTVYLTPDALRAMDVASASTAGHRADTVNRALQVYAAVVDQALLAPSRGTGFKTFTAENLLGDEVAYDVWVRRAR
jgi:hypothetical protein